MSEQKVVKCRCGKDMHPYHGQYYSGCRYWARYECECGWCAPLIVGDTADEAIEVAYLAATPTPPNRPMTLYDAHKYGAEYPDEPLYIEYLGGNPYLTIGYVAAIYMTMFEPAGQGSASYGETWRAWLRKPTQADIEAARKE